MTKMNKFPECERCVNLEFDPFECEDCEQACNFEPMDEDEEEEFEGMSISEFAEYWKENS